MESFWGCRLFHGWTSYIKYIQSRRRWSSYRVSLGSSSEGYNTFNISGDVNVYFEFSPEVTFDPEESEYYAVVVTVDLTVSGSKNIAVQGDNSNSKEDQWLCTYSGGWSKDTDKMIGFRVYGDLLDPEISTGEATDIIADGAKVPYTLGYIGVPFIIPPDTYASIMGNAIIGICYNDFGSPTISDSKVYDTVSNPDYFKYYIDISIQKTLSGLESNTTYYARAFAYNKNYPSVLTYGDEIEFTTINEVTVENIKADRQGHLAKIRLYGEIL